jgi:hypothetical protein
MITYALGPNPQLGGAGRDGLPRGLGGSPWAQNSLQIGALSRQARLIVLQLAFEKYLRSQSLCGSLEQCTDRVNDLAGHGVDEIACLIDFGVADREVFRSLENVTRMQRSETPTGA